MLTSKQMCNVLGVSRALLLRLIASGDIQASKINGRGDLRFHPTEPERYMAACQVRQPA